MAQHWDYSMNYEYVYSAEQESFPREMSQFFDARVPENRRSPVDPESLAVVVISLR